ncbi:unnamed protein product [Phyllotreta striolata]|uniref:Uncharacterized protein n=1 Tax=Phyllotreta striolata TaxID=444603 RepID=A0A9N9XIF7_PHYSR|nr:unnamed protein product [Phyllotreta striolata]
MHRKRFPCANFNRPGLTSGVGPPGYYQRYRSCRLRGVNNDKRHGKYLKHIFNALKNKTSSELVTFINVNSVPNEIEYDISNNALSGGKCYTTYPVQARRTFECDETATSTWKSSRSSRPIRDSNITMASFRVIIGNEMTQAKFAARDTNNSVEQIAETSDEDNANEEFCEYKPTDNFFDKVLSLFKSDNNKSGGDELKLEPIFRNSNCKCSDTVIKLSESKPKRRIDCKCSATVVKLDKFKCDQCGKIDLEKIDESKSTGDEEALLALLNMEANRNCDQIGNIQAQLNEQINRIEDLNRKFTSLLQLVTSKSYTQGDLADVSTETVPAGNKQVEAQLKLSDDSCTCYLKKKPSFFARIFKKSKCNTSCKCCIVPAHDKKQCHYYSNKKKKKNEEKNDDQQLRQGAT